ncbi:MAG: hypothetical protein ABL888_00155 [Pirellulaceae bacterium]
MKAAAIHPDDAETLGNLACAYLLAARIPEATKTINAAIALNATDPINNLLKRIITEVATGTRPQPTQITELTSPAKPPTPPTAKPKSFLSRLAFWKKFVFPNSACSD